MNAVLVHRGPDDSGVHSDVNVALANRRLSIVDPSGGHQPMTSEDGRLTVTYNGEIYNARDLRTTLENRGHRYRTSCDTEAILHPYAEYGTEAISRLRGDFAFALWDKAAQELLLVRDRLGVKPLYFVHAADGTIAFASEIKALLAGHVVQPTLDAGALATYLANAATYGEQTLFAGVRRLPPAHYLRWHDGVVEIQRYWDVEQTPPDSPGSDEDYVEEWRALFRESVRLRLIADVPGGVFLSGGIDSSSIAAVVSDLCDGDVNTFSIGFGEKEANELAYARLVAEHLRTDHREITINGEDVFAALPHLTWHADEPIGHPAGVPLYFVSRLAATEVKVALAGEGGDETLAGYTRYPLTMRNLALGRSYERLTTTHLRRLIARGARRLPLTPRNAHRLSRTFLCRPADAHNLYFDGFAHFGSAALTNLLSSDAAADPYAEAHYLYGRRADADVLQRLLYVDQQTHLHALLMKQDKMTMAASLESRVPFLDHELVALSARLPRQLKLRRGWKTKYVLRRSMRGRLPDAILSARKRGFPVPVDTWFRGRFRSALDEYVLGARCRERGLFEPSYLERLVAEHQDGAAHGQRLWLLVAFEIWARRFLDGEEPAVREPSILSE